MRQGELPAEIRRFILTSIPSVPYLEAVLLLRGEPDQDWDARRLARRLYVGEAQGEALLQALQAAGVAACTQDPQSFRYAPSAQLAAMIDALAQAYAADLMTVTDLIHSRLDKRAQQFAEAFRFRKE